MRTKLYSVLCVTILTSLLFSCNKTDKISELTLPSSVRSALASSGKCDYVKATSKSLSDDETPEETLFFKTYDPQTKKLASIVSHIKTFTAEDYNLGTLRVSYKDSNQYFVKENSTDTLAIITYDRAGKPLYAISQSDFGNDDYKEQFRFIYTFGRLTGIRNKIVSYKHPENYGGYIPKYDKPYISLKYQDSKNLYQVYYGQINGSRKLTYMYDKTRTATGQYYPDETYLSYIGFWVFIKQLNLFPELQPRYLLTDTYFKNFEYPGSERWTYTNHILDGSGKLIGYDVAKKLDVSDYVRNEHWDIDWSCNQ